MILLNKDVSVTAVELGLVVAVKSSVCDTIVAFLGNPTNTYEATQAQVGWPHRYPHWSACHCEGSTEGNSFED